VVAVSPAWPWLDRLLARHTPWFADLAAVVAGARRRFLLAAVEARLRTVVPPLADAAYELAGGRRRFRALLRRPLAGARLDLAYAIYSQRADRWGGERGDRGRGPAGGSRPGAARPPPALPAGRATGVRDVLTSRPNRDRSGKGGDDGVGEGRMPDDATWDDLMYEIYVKQKVADGQQAAVDGRLVPHRDARKRVAKK
jgi:hypothetical protein